MTRDRRLRIAALVLVWTIIVYLAGPIVATLVRAENFRASLARMDEAGRDVARYRATWNLLDLDNARNPPPVVQAQMMRDYCGYDQSQDDAVIKGMDYLAEAAALSDGRFRRLLRQQRATALFSDFGLGFLGNCITSTVLARACERHVAHALDRTGMRYAQDMPRGSPDGHEQRTHARVNCRYLDGVAARAGRPLANAQAADGAPGD